MMLDIFPRAATPADAPAIAALHAASWQAAYRGDFSDHYLDVECPAERLAVWTERFAAPNPNMVARVLEEDGKRIVGFCCTFYDYDEHGSYLDNLHVAKDYHGWGFGRTLMVDTARQLADRDPNGSFYLVVLTSNQAAIGFYERMGGRFGKVSHRNLAGNTVEVVAVHWTLRDFFRVVGVL
ncbi:MAG: GNAT family N-acetyltransferase [Bacteroidota bacterium]